MSDTNPDTDALRIAATAFESQEAMMVTDANRIILKVNKATFDMTGYSSEEMVGQDPRMLSSGRQNRAFYALMWDSIHRNGSWVGEIWNRKKNGELYLSLSTITAVKDTKGVITHYVGTQLDITSRKQAEEEIRRLALFDVLTGLPNRRFFIDRMTQCIAQNTHTGLDGALMYIDLDRFKILNDTRGHDMGDLLLQQVAERLSSCVREDDTISRFGGDEFMVMLAGLSGNQEVAYSQAKTIGQKILGVLNQPYNLAGYFFNATSSIGITLLSDQKGDIPELLKRADLAMYQAKQAGRNRLTFFDEKIQAANINRLLLDTEFRKGVQENEFELYFQPQVDIKNHVVGVEGLVRWNHPRRGLVTPSHFIPLAEETGLIVQLGYWVLRTACTQLTSWEAAQNSRHLYIGVNVSAVQFHQPDFVEQVLSIVKQTGANPNKLTLEITESVLLDDLERLVLTMKQLQSHGIRFSLDDFGIGYSTLSYLKRLPFNQLKIDKSFIADALTVPNDAAIIIAIIAFGKSLGLSLIAEGVETEEQRQFLAENDCHLYQGSLFGPALPIAELEVFLNLSFF